EAVVDSTVEANVRSPIAAVPDVEAVRPSPVTGSPQQSDSGRLDPYSGNPVISIRSVSPVTGSPDVTRRGTRWLHIDRKHGRTDPDRNAYGNSGMGCRRQGKRHADQKQKQKDFFGIHFSSPS